jgi:hypothetical protein
MHTAKNKTVLERRFAAAFVIASMVWGALSSSGQENGRGAIKGTVTADQGKLHEFRVAAHNLDRGLSYTVLNRQGPVRSSAGAAWPI